MHASAQFQKEIERFQFETDIIYDASITSPAEYLGYELGVEYSFHHKVMGYFELLADESEKLTSELQFPKSNLSNNTTKNYD